MKTLKFLFLIFVIAFLTCNNSFGQTVMHKETLVTIYDSGIDYGAPIGKVTGTYKYYFTIRLNKLGELESLQWHAGDWNLVNDNGDPVKVIDTGGSTLGSGWDFFNNKDAYNVGWNISYEIPDGWLNEWWPALLPIEGSNINMSVKILCKGNMLKWSFMTQVHINANGEITVNFIKP
jgi:hypothetical protein